MHPVLRLLTVSAGLLLAGCSTIAGSPARVTNLLPHEKAVGKVTPPTGDSRLADLSSAIRSDCYTIPPTTMATKERRSQIAKIYMLRADESYYQYELALLNDNRQLNFLATIASLGLATAGSAAGGHTARVLSAANAGLIGERTAFTKEYLFDKTLTALQNQMRANRSAVATRIYAGLTRPVDEYTTCDALRDLLAYEQAGTLAEGLTGIADTTAQKAGEEKKAEEAAKLLVYAVSPLAIALRDYFGPADDTLMASRVAGGLKIMPMVGLKPPDGMSVNEYFGRMLAGDEYASQQRALALGVLMTETDVAARTPIAEALK
ncbi:hypothetical protein [uncultured Sphingomonas sp.]|uniref:hypothetical protein n=1 Tax=uncultured Sphingomonas sp. TaxID=158754 RepID=UPI0035CBFA36